MERAMPSQDDVMVEIGSVVRAKVTRVEPYGIYLDHEGQTVCVLAPDIAWRDTRKLLERAHLGEEYEVRVLRYNYRDRIIVGSIRLLHPEENPYRELARLEPATVLRGCIQQCARDTVTIELPNGAWGHIAKRDLPPGVQKGAPMDVAIASLEVDEGRLWLEAALPTRSEANGSPPQPSGAKV